MLAVMDYLGAALHLAIIVVSTPLLVYWFVQTIALLRENRAPRRTGSRLLRLVSI